MGKKVSIIIPCFNLTKTCDCGDGKEDVFDTCMQSVFCQTIGMENVEIVLVNDASTDAGNTDLILRHYEQQYPEDVIVVTLSENMRQGGARNVGLSYATGEYVAFLDADDWVDVTLFEKTCKMADHYDLDMVYFFHQAVKGDLKVPMDDMDTPTGVYEVHTVLDRKAFLMTQIVDLRCTTKLYRRAFLKETGVSFPEHKIYEEPKFTYPLLFYGTKYGVLAENLYNYRMNENSTMNTSHRFERLRNHPEVQFSLFKEMVERELLEEYYDEITYHFLHSFFCETLLFSANQNIEVPIDFFMAMQNIVKQCIPDWEQNTYIKMSPESVTSVILQLGLKQQYDQETLTEFCKRIKQVWE